MVTGTAGVGVAAATATVIMRGHRILTTMYALHMRTMADGAMLQELTTAGVVDTDMASQQSAYAADFMATVPELVEAASAMDIAQSA